MAPGLADEMFELPDAKRVRRSELRRDSSSSSSSTPPSGDFLQEQYTKQLEFDLEFIDLDRGDLFASRISNATLQRPKDPQPNPAEDGSEAFEFRLFSTGPHPTSAARCQLNATAPPRTSHSGIHRIIIRPPTPPTSASDGAFVIPYRPQTYYFANVADLERKAYADAAVSGGQVLERASRTKWRLVELTDADIVLLGSKPGTALPWRVIHLSTSNPSSSSNNRPTLPASTATRTKTRRTRAGKKRRIAMRKKYAARTAQVEMEREKRTRRNREKKVKKKEREKLKKEISKGAMPAGTNDSA